MRKIEFNLSTNNLHIVDSWKIKNRVEMEEILKSILPDRFLKARSIDSYVREWCAHNLLYSWHFKIDRTKDCDLNMDESRIRRLGYFFLSLLY